MADRKAKSALKQRDESMSVLISSIREQTTQLKAFPMQKNLSSSFRHHEVSKSAVNEGKVLPRSPFTPRKSVQISADSTSSPGTDFQHSKTLVENLLLDNKAFRDEVEDYKEVLTIVVQECKTAQKALEVEQIQSQEVELLEAQIEEERAKTKSALETSTLMRTRYLEMLEAMRQSVFEFSEQDKEEQVMIEYLNRENLHLREMLGLSRLTDKKIGEIEDVLRLEEAGVDPSQDKELASVLQLYRKVRQQRKRDRRQKPGEKTFLLTPEKPPAETSWDAFFKAKEDLVGQQSTESYDQMEEPK